MEDWGPQSEHPDVANFADHAQPFLRLRRDSHGGFRQEPAGEALGGAERSDHRILSASRLPGAPSERRRREVDTVGAWKQSSTKGGQQTWERQTAGLEGVIAGESEICYIDGYEGILSYRGYNIHTLADNATFEEVIFLLWNGWLPKQAELDQLKKDLAAEREPARRRWSISCGACPRRNPMDVLRTAVSMLSLYDPEAQDMSAEANHRKAIRLMSQDRRPSSPPSTACATASRCSTAIPSLGFAANFLYTLTGKRPDDVMERAFDVAMILHADHELNASTFAARVTAATLSDIYSSITSGIGALKGPLHGGANQDVIKWLLEPGRRRGSRGRA